jgi:outer membrane protein assembly factor BamB
MMRRLTVLATVSISLLSPVLGLARQDPDQRADPALPAFMRGRIDKQEYQRRRGLHMQRLRGNPEKLRYDARSKALQTLREEQRRSRLDMLASGLASTVPALETTSWTFVGPNPIPNGETVHRSDPVSGRTIEILVHPTNPNTVYVGTAQAGLYRTVNGGTTWTPLMDAADSLTVNALAFDPTDATTLFVGTGEAGFTGDSFFGVGLYRILDAHLTPTLEGPFGQAEFRNRSISNVVTAMDAGNVVVFASTSSGGGGTDGAEGASLPARGLYRSLDGMATTPTFARLTGLAGGANLPVLDMVLDPADTTGNTLVVSVYGLASELADQGGIWRTTDALSATPTFTRVLALPEEVRAELTATTGRMWAATGEPDTVGPPACDADEKGALRSSTDGGATWSDPVEDSTSGFCGTQCSSDIAVAVKPLANTTVLLGGSFNGTCSDVLIRSTDGSNFAPADTGLHFDTRVVAFAPSNPNRAYLGSDGGIWRSDDAGASWTSLNNATFSATQFHSIAAHATDGNFMLGGTAGNGAVIMKANGTWTRADRGDAGYSRIDQSDTGTSTVRMYHTYSSFAGPAGSGFMTYATTEDAGNAFENWDCNGCGCDLSGISCTVGSLDNAVLFYPPMEVGPGGSGNPDTVYYANDHLYRSVDEGATMVKASQDFRGATPIAVSAIGIAARDDDARLVGLEDGGVFKTHTGSTTLADVTPAITGTPTSRFVTDAALDPTLAAPQVAYVSFSGFGYPDADQHVFKTTNFQDPAPTWTAVWDPAYDVPVNTLVINPFDTDVVYAGTDIGVFRTTDGGLNWSVYGNNLPPVSVFDMTYHQQTATVRIATHGRGVWEIQDCPVTLGLTSVVPDTGGPGTSVTLTGTGFYNVREVTFGGASAIFTRNSDTSITAIVPDAATTGSVAVMSRCGIATTAFTVPECFAAPTFPSGNGLATDVATCGQVRLTWSAATPACSTSVRYTVYRGTSAGFVPSASNRIAEDIVAPTYKDTAGLTPDTTYWYIVRARDLSSQLEDANLDDEPATAPTTGLATTTTFTNDVEGTTTTFGFIRIDQDADDQWHLPSIHESHSPPNAARFGVVAGTYYDTCQDERLTVGTPSVPIPAGATNVFIKFWTRYDFESPTDNSGWDGMQLEYSTDDGASWTLVPDSNQGGPFITQHPYHPTALLAALASGSTCPSAVLLERPTGTRAWTGTSGGWVEVAADFTALAGQSIRIALRSLTDHKNGSYGAYVDDFTLSYDTVQGCSAPTAAPAAALTSRSSWNPVDNTGTVKLEWRNPSAGSLGSLRIYRKPNTCPVTPGEGTLVESADAPAFGAYAEHDDPGLVPGTYCYALFYFTGANATGSHSTTKTTTAWVSNTLGLAQGKSAWIYNTGATNLSAPGMFSGSAYLASNDRSIHGINPGAAGGDWFGSGSKTWTPTPLGGVSQARPLVVPLPVNPVMGATTVAFVSAQDGSVSAINAATGATLWTYTSPAVTSVQGIVGLAAREYGIALTGVDLALFGSRNASADNSLRAVNAGTGALAWSFDNLGGGTGIGIISGSVSIDYANKRAYFASRARAGGSNHTLWCVTFTETSASYLWSRALGDIDGSPSVRNGKVYVGNNAGILYAVNAATGATVWSYDTEDGFVKGIPVSNGLGQVYFATNGKVWGLTESGTVVSLLWQLSLPGPSAAVPRPGGSLLVGGSDGKLHVLRSITTASPTLTSYTIGDGTAIVGAPASDATGIYVGTETGGLYFVALAL